MANKRCHLAVNDVFISGNHQHQAEHYWDEASEKEPSSKPDSGRGRRSNGGGCSARQYGKQGNQNADFAETIEGANGDSQRNRPMTDGLKGQLGVA